MKELSLKQLYGYSIMSWEIYFIKISKADEGRYCSFCRDVERQDEYGNLDCKDCRINPIICSSRGDDLYEAINETSIKMDIAIRGLIRALRIEYNKL